MSKTSDMFRPALNWLPHIVLYLDPDDLDTAGLAKIKTYVGPARCYLAIDRKHRHWAVVAGFRYLGRVVDGCQWHGGGRGSRTSPQSGYVVTIQEAMRECERRAEL